MFRQAICATRPAVLAARSKPSPSLIRAFSSTVRVLSGGPQPQLYGEGAKPGTVPTDVEQATGLERLQLLGEIEGIKVFDDSPLDSSRLGTKANPILVPSYVCLGLSDCQFHSLSFVFWQDVERIIGCSGFPAESHDVLWFPVKKDKQARCTECGSGMCHSFYLTMIFNTSLHTVYALDFQGEEHHDAQHH